MEYEARGEKNKQGKQNSANSHDVFVCFSKQQQQHKQEQQRMCMILCFCDAQLPCKLLLSSATHAGSAENCVSGWGGQSKTRKANKTVLTAIMCLCASQTSSFSTREGNRGCAWCFVFFFVQLSCNLLPSSVSQAGTAEECARLLGRGAEQQKLGLQNSANTHNLFVCFSKQQLQHKHNNRGCVWCQGSVLPTCSASCC